MQDRENECKTERENARQIERMQGKEKEHKRKTDGTQDKEK